MRREHDEATIKLGTNIQINEGREKGFRNEGREGYER